MAFSLFSQSLSLYVYNGGMCVYIIVTLQPKKYKIVEI